MSKKTKLNLLWTNADEMTAEKMVFMYTINSLRNGWWEEVTLIIWGATTKMVSENKKIQSLIKEALDSGVHVSACKACSDQLGVTDVLIEMGIEVIYWGEPLTNVLKDEVALLTV